MTARTERRLPAHLHGTAEALDWCELSVAPMQVTVHLCRGHEPPTDMYCDKDE